MEKEEKEQVKVTKGLYLCRAPAQVYRAQGHREARGPQTLTRQRRRVKIMCGGACSIRGATVQPRELVLKSLTNLLTLMHPPFMIGMPS